MLVCGYCRLFSPFFKLEIFAFCCETLYSLNINSAVFDFYVFVADLHYIKSVFGIQYFACHLHWQRTWLSENVANFIHIVCKSLKLLTSVKITNFYILYIVLATFQAWNICFIFWSPLLPQYMMCCHKFLWIRGSPLHTCCM